MWSFLLGYVVGVVLGVPAGYALAAWLSAGDEPHKPPEVDRQEEHDGWHRNGIAQGMKWHRARDEGHV